MSESKISRWLDRNGATLALALAVLAGFIGFFDRSLNYHDEILNTNKAVEGIVLDYAMRPVFYGLNVVALKVFGNHTYSLVVLSIVSLAITALCVFFTAKRYVGSVAGILSVVALLAPRMARDYGVRAMAHMHAGMFMALSLYFALRCFEEEGVGKRRAFGMAAGLLAIVSFSTHPTMAGYLVGLCTFAAMTWLLGLTPWTRSGSLVRGIAPGLWIAIGLALGLAILVVIYAIWYHEPYFSAWIRFAKVPQGPESQRGFSLYYVRTLLRKGALPFVFLGASLLVAMARHWLRPKAEDAGGVTRSRAFALAMPLYCLIVAAGMASLNQWKHGRLLVSFLPLLALSMGCWSALALEAFDSLFGRQARLAKALGLSLFLGMAGIGMLHEAATVRAQSDVARTRYLSLYETLRNLPASRIGVLVGPGKVGTKASFVHAARLEAVLLPRTKKMATLKDSKMREVLIANAVTYVYWDLASTEDAERPRIAATLRQLGGARIAEWRGLREIWLVPLYDASFADTLSSLEPSARVAVFGDDTELSSTMMARMRNLVEGHELRAYLLNVRKRTPARELHYVVRNQAAYVLMPVAPDGGVTQEAIDAMIAKLQEVGAVQVEAGSVAGLQLWHIPDLQRAAAAAAQH